MLFYYCRDVPLVLLLAFASYVELAMRATELIVRVFMKKYNSLWHLL